MVSTTTATASPTTRTRPASARLRRVAAPSLLLLFALTACSDVVRDGAGGGAAPVGGEDPAMDGPRFNNSSVGFTSSKNDDDDDPDDSDVDLPGVSSGDADGDGFLDTLEDLIGTDPEQDDAPCAHAREEVEVVELDPEDVPMDFIILVDTSGSMVEELPRIERGVTSLIDRLLSRERDFNVILIAQTQEAFEGSPRLCVSVPNGDGACPETAEANEHFLQYDAPVSSNNSLDLIVSTLTMSDPHGLAPLGWGERLRRDSFKVFVTITDDNARMPVDTFMITLQQLDLIEQYGFFVGGQSNFAFHSVIGVDAPDLGLTPDDPIDAEPCATAPNAGLTYQDLALRTGGLRFSVCGEPDYTRAFDAIADVEPRRIIGCEYPLPEPDADAELDLERLAIQFERGRAGLVLARAAGPNACGPGGDFYLADATLALCPSTCDALLAEDSIDAVTVAAACVCEGGATAGCE